MSGFGAQGARGDEPEPVIRDNRRIDPQTGEIRQPGSGPTEGSSPFPGAGGTPPPIR